MFLGRVKGNRLKIEDAWRNFTQQSADIEIEATRLLWLIKSEMFRKRQLNTNEEENKKI